MSLSSRITVAALVLVLASLATAEVPLIINYQGRLTDASGDPVPDVQHAVTFAIYDVPTGGSDSWSTMEKVTPTNGLFSIQLGESPQPVLPASLFDGSPRYLGITIFPDLEMTPRTQLVSVPYAYHALKADELANVPGIASEINSAVIIFTQGSGVMVDLETVTITTPADGYIIVEGTCFAHTYGTTGINRAYIQIDETAGGGLQVPYCVRLGLGSASTPAVNAFPVHVTRIFEKPAGTHTFRMEGAADGSNGVGAWTETMYHQLTAVFYPTSYAPVRAMVSSDEAGQFDQAVAEEVTVFAPDGTRTTETMYRVDLRELELKAVEARAEAERAERELLQARIKQMNEKKDERR